MQLVNSKGSTKSSLRPDLGCSIALQLSTRSRSRSGTRSKDLSSAWLTFRSSSGSLWRDSWRWVTNMPKTETTFCLSALLKSLGTLKSTSCLGLSRRVWWKSEKGWISICFIILCEIFTWGSCFTCESQWHRSWYASTWIKIASKRKWHRLCSMLRKSRSCTWQRFRYLHALIKKMPLKVCVCTAKSSDLTLTSLSKRCTSMPVNTGASAGTNLVCSRSMKTKRQTAYWRTTVTIE